MFVSSTAWQRKLLQVEIRQIWQSTWTIIYAPWWNRKNQIKVNLTKAWNQSCHPVQVLIENRDKQGRRIGTSTTTDRTVSPISRVGGLKDSPPSVMSSLVVCALVEWRQWHSSGSEKNGGGESEEAKTRLENKYRRFRVSNRFSMVQDLQASQARHNLPNKNYDQSMMHDVYYKGKILAVNIPDRA